MQVFGRTEVCLDKLPISVEIVKNLPYSFLIGNDILDLHKGCVNYKDKRLELNGKYYPFVGTDNAKTSRSSIGETSIRTGISPLDSVLKKYNKIFYQKGSLVGKAKGIPPMQIKTESRPIAQRSYRAPLLKRHLMDEEIDAMLRDNIIRPSQSPWSSPVILVPKRDGSTRFCVDYRKLNAVTKRDQYPLPYIQDIFDTVGNGRIFTTLDLKSEYWQPR